MMNLVCSSCGLPKIINGGNGMNEEELKRVAGRANSATSPERPYLTSTDFDESQAKPSTDERLTKMWDQVDEAAEAHQNGHPRFYEILEGQAKLHSMKNTDYAKGGLQGPLGNFTRVAMIMSLYSGVHWDSPFGVAMCYLLKQLDATMMLFVRAGEHATDEDVSSRLNDVAVYANIAQIIWAEGGPGATGGEFPVASVDELGD